MNTDKLNTKNYKLDTIQVSTIIHALTSKNMELRKWIKENEEKGIINANDKGIMEQMIKEGENVLNVFDI